MCIRDRVGPGPGGGRDRARRGGRRRPPPAPLELGLRRPGRLGPRRPCRPTHPAPSPTHGRRRQGCPGRPVRTDQRDPRTRREHHRGERNHPAAFTPARGPDPDVCLEHRPQPTIDRELRRAMTTDAAPIPTPQAAVGPDHAPAADSPVATVDRGGSGTRLRDLHPGWLASVMGTAIVAVASYDNPGNVTALRGVAHRLGVGLAVLAYALGAVLVVAYLIRWVHHSRAALADLRH